MKKALLIGLTAAALASAYPVASWLLGRQIEAALDEQYREIKEQPYVRLVRREYDRGVFSSTERATFQILDRFPHPPGNAWNRTDGVDAMPEVFGADPAEHKPLRFTLRSRIRHGPLPGLAAVAAAVADSELDPELEIDAAAELTTALRGGKPLTIHTVFRFDGGGTSTLASPAFAARFPAGEGERGLLISSAGLNAEVDFAEGMKRYRFHGAMPRLVLQEGDGTHLVMSDLKFDGTQARVYDDEPMLLAGTQNFAVDELSVGDGRPGSAGLVVKRLAYRVDVPVAGDFIDIAGKLGAEAVHFGAEPFGPVNYDISLRHLHARSVARLYRAIARLYADTAQPSVATEAFAPLAEPALALMNHGAELSLDRLSFTTPQGETRLEARVRLAEAGAADLRNPLLLLSRLEVAGEIGLPEALLAALPQLLAGAGGSDDEGAPDAGEIAARGDQLRRQVDVLVRQGYIERDGGRICSRVEFKNGRLAVNGRPFKTVADALPGAPAAMHPMQ